MWPLNLFFWRRNNGVSAAADPAPTGNGTVTADRLAIHIQVTCGLDWSTAYRWASEALTRGLGLRVKKCRDAEAIKKLLNKE